MDKNKANVDPELQLAKELIMAFVTEEYDGELRPFDYTDLEHIAIAYTITEDGEHEIQTEINLKDYSTNQYIDGELVHSEKYQSLHDFIEFELRFLDFSNLIYVDDKTMERFVDPLDLDKDNDGVIDRYDADETDSKVATYGDLDKRDSLIGALKSNKKSVANENQEQTREQNKKIELYEENHGKQIKLKQVIKIF